MYARLPGHLNGAVKPIRALILARSESSVRMDVKALCAVGMKECVYLADARSALAFLGKEAAGGNAVDLVVCDENLRDGPVSAFLSDLAGSRHLRVKPVLVLAGTTASAKALRAASLCVLQRPYSPNDLEGMIKKAMSPMRQPLRVEAFAGKKEAAAPKPPAKADKSRPFTIMDWYDKGIAHLKAGELPDAERALMRVLDGQEDHPEAALGLARLHHATGNGKRMRRYLLKAAVSCLRQGDTERAHTIAGRLSGCLAESMGKNLYLSEAVACLEEDRGKAAAIAFLDAAREGIPLHQLVARACLQTLRPDESMVRVCEAFEGMGHTVTATSLRHRLLNYTPFEGVPPASWLDRFPRLKEVVTVASYAAQAWKEVRAY
jgi:hypothetical protein